MAWNHPPEHPYSLQLVLITIPIFVFIVFYIFDIAIVTLPAPVRRCNVTLDIFIENSFRTLHQVVFERTKFLDESRPGFQHVIESVTEVGVFVRLFDDKQK